MFVYRLSCSILSFILIYCKKYLFIIQKMKKILYQMNLDLEKYVYLMDKPRLKGFQIVNFGHPLM
jgi:hypothetical protein